MGLIFDRISKLQLVETFLKEKAEISDKQSELEDRKAKLDEKINFIRQSIDPVSVSTFKVGDVEYTLHQTAGRGNLACTDNKHLAKFVAIGASDDILNYETKIELNKSVEFTVNDIQAILMASSRFEDAQ